MGKRLRLAYSESSHEKYKQLLCRNDKNQMKISASIQGNMREKSPLLNAARVILEVRTAKLFTLKQQRGGLV